LTLGIVLTIFELFTKTFSTDKVNTFEVILTIKATKTHIIDNYLLIESSGLLLTLQIIYLLSYSWGNSSSW